MKTVKVKIEGISPLLFNRFKESSEMPPTMRKNTKKDYGTPRVQAEATAYKDDNGKLWMPSSWVKGAMQTIASDYTLPSSRKSVKSVLGGCVRPSEEKLYFLEKYTIKNIEVDSRPVVIQRARVMKHRARLETWSIECFLEIEDDILPIENVHEILGAAGRRSGFGDFRPQKGGQYGRYQIVGWEII